MVMKRRLKGTRMRLSYIFGILMIRMGMKSEKTTLTPAQKCHYTQMNLAGEAY